MKTRSSDLPKFALGRPWEFTEIFLANEMSVLGRPVDKSASASCSEKGLGALNAIPKGQSATVGSSLVTATSEGTRDWPKIGDLVGVAIGGFTKSMTG
jgi:hypothetical protein